MSELRDFDADFLRLHLLATPGFAIDESPPRHTRHFTPPPTSLTFAVFTRDIIFRPISAFSFHACYAQRAAAR
jgi:hypothetical protein